MSYVKSLQSIRKELTYRANNPAPAPAAPARRGFMGGVAPAAPVAKTEELKYNPMEFVMSSMQNISQARRSFQETVAADETTRKASKGSVVADVISKVAKKDDEPEVSREEIEDTKDEDMSPVANMSGGGPLARKAGSKAIKEDAAFLEKVSTIANKYGTDAASLLSVMHFETGGSFDTGTRNAAGSGATGLIQFMPSTAKGLGTSTDALAKMDRMEQLDWVDKYLSQTPLAKEGAKSTEDVYMSVLYPKAVGKSNDYVLFEKGTKAYAQNAGLDIGGKGYVTKADAASKVMQYVEDYRDV